MKNVLYPGMEHFAYVLYVGFCAQRNLSHKKSVLKMDRPVYWTNQFSLWLFISMNVFFLFGTNFIWELTTNISNRQNLKTAIHKIASIVAKIVENWRKLVKIAKIARLRQFWKFQRGEWN